MAVNNAADNATCQIIVQNFQHSGKVSEYFSQKGKGTLIYSNIQHTITETRAELIHWICESLHPFNIVSDHGFNCLMKTGHPGYCIPLPSTVGHNVKSVFAWVQKQIAKMLQVSNCSGMIFSTDFNQEV